MMAYKKTAQKAANLVGSRRSSHVKKDHGRRALGTGSILGDRMDGSGQISPLGSDLGQRKSMRAGLGNALAEACRSSQSHCH
jgi:hypothetical protein